MIMNIFFENTVTSELIVVYGLITLVLILIVVILVLDKKEKNRKKDLFNNKFINTVKMKPVNSNKTNEEAKETVVKEKKQQPKPVTSMAIKDKKEKSVKAEQKAINDLEDILEKTTELTIPQMNDFKFPKESKTISEIESDNTLIKAKKTEPEKVIIKKSSPDDSIIDISDTQIISVKDIKQSLAQKTEKLKQPEVLKKEPTKKKEIEQLEEIKEEELSKTQAQLSLEALHKELEKAIANERNNIDNLEQLEEDEAIISYDQLVKVSDKIYEENETSEYLDENDYPITIDELRKKFQQEMTEVKSENTATAKVQLQEFVDEKEIEELASAKTTSSVRESIFRTTPIISPVYGIQSNHGDDTELLTDKNETLDDISSETASELLNRLKEFSSNH